MLQQSIVAAIVVCAFWAVARRYMPKAMRRALRGWWVRGARKAGWNAFAERLEMRAESGGSCGDGCGSCGACGSAGNEAAPNEFSISIDSLKRSTSVGRR